MCHSRTGNGQDDSEEAGSDEADEDQEGTTPKKPKQAKGSQQAGMGGSPGSDSTSTPEKEKQEKQQDKWFDESKTRKAERTWDHQMQALKRDLVKLNEDMTSVLLDFRSKPSQAAEFASEMILVQKRQEWVNAVLDEDDSILSEKINSMSQMPGEDVSTDSRDVGALSRAGPCAGYEALITFSALAGKGVGFRTCTSQDDIKQKLEAALPGKKVITTLMSACRTAVNELNAARKKAQVAKEKQKEKELKEAADKKKAASAAVQGGVAGAETWAGVLVFRA